MEVVELHLSAQLELDSARDSFVVVDKIFRTSGMDVTMYGC